MAGDPRDYKVELSSSAPETGDGAATGRPFIGVKFACCGVYQRIYRSADGTQYAGRCPRCARAVKFNVGQGGTECRTFIVS